MSVPAGWIAVAAALGLCLVLAGQRMRRCRGLGGGRTVSFDRVTLTSHRPGLTGLEVIVQGGKGSHRP